MFTTPIYTSLYLGHMYAMDNIEILYVSNMSHLHS